MSYSLAAIIDELQEQWDILYEDHLKLTTRYEKLLEENQRLRNQLIEVNDSVPKEE